MKTSFDLNGSGLVNPGALVTFKYVMGIKRKYLKPVVAAALMSLAAVSAASADDKVDLLLDELRSADGAAAERIAEQLRREWDKSGSASADLLLSRGRKAMAAGEIDAAIEHFTALTDHAPEFSEGWVDRAGAYLHAGLYGPALSDLERALVLNPNHFEAINGLAVILETINRPVDAYEAYLLVKAIHPNHPDVTEALKRLEPVVKGQKL